MDSIKISENKSLGKMISAIIILFIIGLNGFAQDKNLKYNEFFQYYSASDFQNAKEIAKEIQGDESGIFPDMDSLKANLYSSLAYIYFNEEDYEKAIANSLKAYKTWKEIVDKDDLRFLTAAFDLGIYYTYIGDYDKSMPLLIEVVKSFENTYGEEDINSIYINLQLASVYNSAGSYYNAMQTYDRIWLNTQKALPETDTFYMQIANTVSTFYYTTGNFQKSEPFFVSSIEQMEKYYGKLSKEYVTTLNSMGEFYLNAGMYSKAEKVFTEFVDLCEKFYSKKSTDYATALNNLAVVFEKSGNYHEAEKLYLNCLKIKEKVYTKESDFYALSLTNLAVLYDNMGRYSESEPLFLQALEIYERTYGANHDNYAIALSNLGSVLTTNGKYKQAKELFETALKSQEAKYGKTYSGYISTLNNLAYINSYLGDQNLALDQFNEVVELRVATQGINHPEYAVSLFNLANLHSDLGNYIEAEKMLLDVLKIQEQQVGKNHPSYANTVNSIAGLYTFLGDYVKAESYYFLGYNLFKNIYGTLHPEYAVFITNFGQFYKEVGGYEKATEYLTKALEIQKGVFGSEHQDNVPIISNLAGVYLEKHNYSKAEELLVKAAELSKKNLGEQHTVYINSINNLGNFYYNLGNNKQAVKSFEFCLDANIKLFGEKNEEVANTRNNLGSALMALALEEDNPAEVGKLIDKARDCFVKTLSVDTLLGKSNHPDHALHLNNFAEFYTAIGENILAKPLLLRSIAIEEEVFGKDHSLVAVGYHNLSLLLIKTGNYDEAIVKAEKALEIKKKAFGEKSTTLSDTYGTLAYIYEQAGNLNEAKNSYLNNMDLNAKGLKNVFGFLSEEEKSAFLNSVLYYSGLFKNFVSNNYETFPELTGVLINNELLIKGVLLRSTRNMKNTIAEINDPELSESFDKWLNLHQELAICYRNTENSNIHKTDSLEILSNEIEKSLVKASSSFVKESQLVAESWEKIKSRLKPGEAAIEITKFDYFPDSTVQATKYIALVVKYDSEFPTLIELFNEDELIEILGNINGTAYHYITGLYKDESLYNLVWKPMEKSLDKCQTVYFSPSGLLNRISFSAIRNEKDFLCNQVNFLQLNSIAEAGLEKSLAANKNISALVMGGAKYSTTDTLPGTWNYLKGTLEEANSVEGIFINSGINVQTFTGANANEENLKLAVNEKSPEIIHIATHGFFYPNPDLLLVAETVETGDLEFRGKSLGYNTFVANKNPLMRSGLVLSGANDVWQNEKIIGEDGVLTAYEVSNLNLNNTNLVVLSACETGLGDIKGSEGVYGLSRAFRLAGADALVISLWQVPDTETADFMQNFYNKLMKIKNIRKAFNQTQQEMSKKYEPYFWGAFVLID